VNTIITSSVRRGRIIEIEPSADARWDDFVAGYPNGLIYHHSLWIRALQDEYRQPQVNLACETGEGDLCGILPLVRTRGLPFNFKTGVQATGGRLSSLPRTPVAGPLRG